MKANKETKRSTRLLKLVLACTVIFTTLTFAPKKQVEAADADVKMNNFILPSELKVGTKIALGAAYDYTVLNTNETEYGGKSILLGVMGTIIGSNTASNEYRDNAKAKEKCLEEYNLFTDLHKSLLLESRRSESAPYVINGYQFQDCAIEGEKVFMLPLSKYTTFVGG